MEGVSGRRSWAARRGADLLFALYFPPRPRPRASPGPLINPPSKLHAPVCARRRSGGRAQAVLDPFPGVAFFFFSGRRPQLQKTPKSRPSRRAHLNLVRLQAYHEERPLVRKDGRRHGVRASGVRRVEALSTEGERGRKNESVSESDAPPDLDLPPKSSLHTLPPFITPRHEPRIPSKKKSTPSGNPSHAPPCATPEGGDAHTPLLRPESRKKR